jgi:hypothetical protein
MQVVPLKMAPSLIMRTLIMKPFLSLPVCELITAAAQNQTGDPQAGRPKHKPLCHVLLGKRTLFSVYIHYIL